MRRAGTAKPETLKTRLQNTRKKRKRRSLKNTKIDVTSKSVESARRRSDGDWQRRADDEVSEEDQKVIVRSNGTVGYVGKDIAYHMWKFGLLGRDFVYRIFYKYPNNHHCWVSADERRASQTIRTLAMWQKSITSSMRGSRKRRTL